MLHIFRPIGVCFCLLLSLLLLSRPAPAHAQLQVEFERWYLLELAGQPAGWMHARQGRDGAVIRSASQMKMVIKRGPITLNITTETSFDETPDGKPLSATVTQQLGAMTIKQEMRFTEQGIELLTEQAGQKSQRRYPNPRQAWLPPAAAGRYAQAQIAAGAQEIEVWTLEPSAGPTPLQTVSKLRERVNLEVVGKVVPTLLWDCTMSNLPGMQMQIWTDEQAQPVRSSVTPMPGMELVLLQADKELALAQVNPPELMVQTFVKPDRQIAQPRALRQGTYLLSLTASPAPDQAAAPIASAVQQVEAVGANRWRVQVDMDQPQAADAPPGAECLAASAMLNHEDPAVRALLAQAWGDAIPATPADKAERLRQFVNQYIEGKNLSVGYATASETARTRQGDCTEHAMLLAALLRAADIPSRTASGLVYADEFLGQRGIFGYHMWAQAWLPEGDAGRWVDLDPTLDAPQPFDATHLLLSVSAQEDGKMVNDMMALVPMLGRLRIQVIQP